jgi:hypothetical protein
MRIGIASVFVCLVLAAGGTGCGPSEEEQKTTAALERMQNRRKPGFVRVLNLSSDAVQLADGNRTLVSSLASNNSSSLLPLGEGRRTLTLTQDSGTQPVVLEVASQEGTTLVVRTGNKPFHVNGELRYPSDLGNVRVVCLEPNGEVSATDLKLTATGLTKVAVLPGSQVVSLTPGEWTFKGNGVPPLKVTIVDKFAYTLLLLRKSGGTGIQSHWMLNTPDEKPSGMAAAAS